MMWCREGGQKGAEGRVWRSSNRDQCRLWLARDGDCGNQLEDGQNWQSLGATALLIAAAAAGAGAR